MKTRKFWSWHLTMVRRLCITQTPEQEKNKSCYITGYQVGPRTEIGRYDRKESEDGDFVLVKNPQMIVTEIVLFDRGHRKPTESIKVDNQARENEYGPEGTNHELDPS